MKLIYPCLLILFTGCLLRADSTGLESSQFSHQRILEASDSGEGLGILPLDADVFRLANENLGDLRLLSESGGDLQEMPYLIERKAVSDPGKNARPIPSKVLDFSQSEDGAIEVVIELEEKAGNAALLKIETPLRDFEKQIEVSGSSDEVNWSPLVSEGLIFDHERFLDFRRTSVELPQNEYRWFRVRISAATDQQKSLVRSLRRTVSESSGVSQSESFTVSERNFRIDRFSFYTEEKPFEERMSTFAYPARILSNEVNEEEKRTEIVLDIESCPVDTLVFKTGDRNFRRSVEVQVPRSYNAAGEVEQWRAGSNGKIHRYQIGDFSDENLRLSFSPPSANQRAKKLRIMISHGDSPPIGIESVKAFGEIYEVKFLAPMSGPPRLLFGGGNQDLRKPSYDLSAIRIADREKVKKVAFSAGPLMANEAFAGEPKGPVLNQTWILWLVIAVVVFVLIFVLFKTGTKVQDALEEEEE